MTLNPSLAMTPEELEILKNIVNAHLPGCRVWAFGSRVAGGHKQYSDLDLALFINKAIPLDTRAALGEALSNSAIPYKVDILDWATTSESFQRIIEKQKIDIPL